MPFYVPSRWRAEELGCQARISHCSGVPQVQESWEVSVSERSPLREICWPRRAQRVSLWAAVYWPTRKFWASVTTMFHPGCNSGQWLSLKVWEQKYHPTWVVIQEKKKKGFQGCSLRKKGKSRGSLDSTSSWEHSLPDKLKRGSSQGCSSILRPNELFSDYNVVWRSRHHHKCSYMNFTTPCY